MRKILMCSPDYYDVTYSINPWMDTKVKVDKNLAKKQWQEIKDLVANFLAINVCAIKQKPGVPDMVFSADQGIVIGNTFIEANFTYPQRQKENKFYHSWFKKNGYKIINLPQKFKFEGGDFLLWNDKILAGYGFRTNKLSAKKVAQLIGKKLVALQLIDPFLYHLDMALFPLDEQSLVYYPGAFSPASRHLIEENAELTIKVSRDDALAFILNSIIKGKKILTKLGVNSLFSQLKNKGFQLIQADVSEFEKSGGGIHCLVCCFH